MHMEPHGAQGEGVVPAAPCRAGGYRRYYASEMPMCVQLRSLVNSNRYAEKTSNQKIS